MMSGVTIRAAQRRDLPELLAIYNHYVINTPITFDLEPRTLAQREEWLDGFATTGKYRCFLALRDDRPIGWTCAPPVTQRAASHTSIETSAYPSPHDSGRRPG